MRYKNKSAKARRIRFILLLIFIIILGSFIYSSIGDKIKGSWGIPEDEPFVLEDEVPIEEEKPEEVTIKLTAIGDVALGRDYRSTFKNSMDEVFEKNGNDYGYFFAKVSHIFNESDLTVANLENAFTLEKERPEKYDYGNNYWFKGDPKYARVLKEANIDVVSLSNNHTYDYGQKGYDDTKEALDTVGVSYFGYDDLYETNIKGVNIGFVGINELGEYEQGTDKEELKADIESKINLLRNNNDYVIATFHWGKEYVHEHNETQRDLAYFAIDKGADLIIGTHSHVIQGIENYNGKYIIYSLGNFCFGGNKNPPDYDTFIYQQDIVFEIFKDEITLIETKEPDYIPCYLSGTKGLNNYQPILAKGSDIERILTKINKYSVYKMTEAKIYEKSRAQLVNLVDYIPNILIDLKYGTTDNVAGRVLYENPEPLLRRETADKLKEASKIFNEMGYKVKVWDGYRPGSVQQALWDSVDDKGKVYFANPKLGSNHTRGCAVDVTLTDWDGTEIDMPSGFDDIMGKATRKYVYATATQKANAQMLEKVMKQVGFNIINSEWWHFDDSDYKLYELID
ncbi:MAG: hypothetical protein GX154_01845 [Clostridiales bacterium]|nr:hypothetical protein [Clostridiales bacterium]